MNEVQTDDQRRGQAGICTYYSYLFGYINRVARVISFSASGLAHVAVLNLEKIESRAARGTLKGSGDNR